MLTTRSKRILKKGKSIVVGFFRHNNGREWVANYNEKYYSVMNDGTGNGFFHNGEAEEITQQEVIRIVLQKCGETEGLENLATWDIFPTEKEIDEILGL